MVGRAVRGVAWGEEGAEPEEGAIVAEVEEDVGDLIIIMVRFQCPSWPAHIKIVRERKRPL